MSKKKDSIPIVIFMFCIVSSAGMKSFSHLLFHSFPEDKQVFWGGGFGWTKVFKQVLCESVCLPVYFPPCTRMTGCHTSLWFHVYTVHKLT